MMWTVSDQALSKKFLFCGIQDFHFDVKDSKEKLRRGKKARLPSGHFMVLTLSNPRLLKYQEGWYVSFFPDDFAGLDIRVVGAITLRLPEVIMGRKESDHGLFDLKEESAAGTT